MPDPGKLSNEDLASVRDSFLKIEREGGMTYIDDVASAPGQGGANATAQWFNTAAGSETIGLARAEGMVRSYASHAARAARTGQRLEVHVFILMEPVGTIRVI